MSSYTTQSLSVNVTRADVQPFLNAQMPGTLTPTTQLELDTQSTALCSHILLLKHSLYSEQNFNEEEIAVSTRVLHL